jgi:hypothetical protein
LRRYVEWLNAPWHGVNAMGVERGDDGRRRFVVRGADWTATVSAVKS